MKKKEEAKKEKDLFYRPATDPQGSYTGVPERCGEKPVQDADDL